MSVSFSPTTGHFYADEFRADYVAAGTWPTDTVPVDDSTWQTYIGTPPDGKVRGSVNGAPGWVDAPAVTPPPPSSVITSTAFLNRFTPTELGALASSPATLLLLITCAAAGHIDLSDAAVQAGVNGLTFLAAGRAAGILTP